MIFSRLWSRRSFIQVSLVAALTLFGGPVATARELLEEELPVGSLKLFAINHDERLEITYRDRQGQYDLQALDAINWLFRCHYSDEVHPIDIRTIEYLNLVGLGPQGPQEIHLLSGYRSPKYNDLLLKQSPKVAKHSLHLEGRAVDFRIPDMPLAQLRRKAIDLKLGGVGYYPRSNFLHLDSGDVRCW